MASSASPYPSPASSSTSLSKKNLNSNSHPYAIKTTSTGILSRSSSTRSSTSIHHFVPSSPTKHKSSNDSPRPSGHRYSRSLNTNELPRPLPIPPAFPSSSPSPTKFEFDSTEIDVGQVVSRRERRADTLPSASQPNLLGGLGVGMDDLPDDPRIWSPSQLSTYLAASLRVTSGDLPPLVAKDIATFIRTQKITGKMFLRLTDGDLDKYALNRRWQSALLAASRLLRRDSIRGRIWNPNFGGEEEENENYSSTSSISSSGSINDPQRGRPVVNSGSGSGFGRVKGMVASFERSVSPTKESSRSVSPVKKLDTESTSPDVNVSVNSIQSRSRPQSDIFPSPSSYPTTTTVIPTSESPPPMTNMVVDPELHKKEPRLLPYPPSPAFTASPQQPPGLGAFIPQDPPPPFPSGVLPFSPQSTGPTTISPDHLFNSSSPTGVSGLPQPFQDVRPLPLPPHSGQFYQPLASVSNIQGFVIGDESGGEGRMMGMMSMGDGPRGFPISEGLLVPRVRVGEEHEDELVPPPLPLHRLHSSSQQYPNHVLHPPHQHQHSTQQQQFLHPQQQPEVQILSPQPRHHDQGRESPTKILEQKLEELLEPRPRSRVFPIKSTSHSRVGSGTGSGSGSPSRPRSRVPSTTGRMGIGEKKSNGSIGEGNNNPLQHPRTRVISLSSRTHSHRLSGVEMWGENHRHGVPDERVESEGGGIVDGGIREVEGVKDVESEEEIGIEAVLEKALPIPEVETRQQHTKEGSSGTGSLREPKSVVITLVEPPSTRNEEEEPTMDVLLTKTQSQINQKKKIGGGGGNPLRGGGGGGKKRIPLSGVDAWEMVNVDTMKYVDGGTGRSIEDIFSSSNTTSQKGGEGETRVEKKIKPKVKEEEEELEKQMKETREMVEDVRRRLESVEKWIEDEDAKEKKKRKKEEEEGGLVVVGVVKRVLGLSGISNWFGLSSTSSPSTTSSTTSSNGNANSNLQIKQPYTLIRRLTKNLSTYAVLCGIGMCVVLLRLLGRRPGGGGALGVARFGFGRGGLRR